MSLSDAKYIYIITIYLFPHLEKHQLPCLNSLAVDEDEAVGDVFVLH